MLDAVKAALKARPEVTRFNVSTVHDSGILTVAVGKQKLAWENVTDEDRDALLRSFDRHAKRNGLNLRYNPHMAFLVTDGCNVQPNIPAANWWIHHGDAR